MFHQRGRWRGRERGVETHSFRINRGLGKSSKADEVGRANAREILPAIFNGSSRRKAIRSHPSFSSPPFRASSEKLWRHSILAVVRPPISRHLRTVVLACFFSTVRVEAWLRGWSESSNLASIPIVFCWLIGFSSLRLSPVPSHYCYYYRRQFFVEKLSDAITR